MTTITKTGAPLGNFRGQRASVVQYLRGQDNPVTLDKMVADLTPEYEPLLNEWALKNGGVRRSIRYHFNALKRLGQVKLEGRGEVEDQAGQCVEGETEGVDQTAFALERYLEDFVVSNFAAIFKGKLRIYEDANADGQQYVADGQQYVTDIGPIDILAVESDSGSFVVIELKKGRPSDQFVGQILRYVGWVKKNLCKGGEAVKGLVICSGDPDPKLTYARSK